MSGLNDEDEYVIQIVDNEVRLHNISAEERMKKRKLAARKAKIKAKRKTKREIKRRKREQRRIKVEKELRNERNKSSK